jgi:hypothetical protein
VVTHCRPLLEVGPEHEEGLGLCVGETRARQRAGVWSGEVAGEDDHDLAQAREARPKRYRGDLREVAVQGADALLELQGACVAEARLRGGVR